MLRPHNKRLLVIISIVLAVAVVLSLGLYLLLMWPSFTNPAKNLSAVVVQFAKSEELVQMKEYNGAATGLDNTIPFYDRIYRGTGSIDDLEPKYKAALAATGYTVEDAHFTYDKSCPFESSGPGCPEDRLQGATTNGGQPYWVLRGK